MHTEDNTATTAANANEEELIEELEAALGDGDDDTGDGDDGSDDGDVTDDSGL